MIFIFLWSINNDHKNMKLFEKRKKKFLEKILMVKPEIAMFF